MQKIERRFLSGTELRAKRDGQPLGVVGYAAVFDQLSKDLGGFREKIASGTFASAITEKQDVRCLFNHDVNHVLGRTTSGTLRLLEDSIGLEFDCDFPDNTFSRDLIASIKRGDISQCSFSFRCVEDDWSPDNAIRTLRDVDLLDVSPVTFPAYPQTSLDARALLWPGGAPDELNRALREPTKGISYLFIGKPTPQPAPVRPFDPELETLRARARVRLAELKIRG
jgi:hypothetical protein